MFFILTIYGPLDHKGWDLSKGLVPPTRPVASGNRGMNMNLIEIISDILKPVATGVKETYEKISAEDMVPRMINLDRSLENLDKDSWWEDVKYGKQAGAELCQAQTSLRGLD